MRKKKKLVCGVGWNDADYQITERQVTIDEYGGKKQKITWMCPFYWKWKSMLQRCYSPKLQELRPTYLGCYICEEWLTFSNFKAWMETQDWEGKHLDKDILFPGNKVYSPETCVFVDGKVNSFLTEHGAARGQWLIGVHWNAGAEKYQARCSGGSGKQKYLGLFNTELEAHKAWLSFKLDVARKLATEQTDPRVAKALVDRYENYDLQE